MWRSVSIKLLFVIATVLSCDLPTAKRSPRRVWCARPRAGLQKRPRTWLTLPVWHGPGSTAEVCHPWSRLKKFSVNGATDFYGATDFWVGIRGRAWMGKIGGQLDHARCIRELLAYPRATWLCRTESIFGGTSYDKIIDGPYSQLFCKTPGRPSLNIGLCKALYTSSLLNCLCKWTQFQRYNGTHWRRIASVN